MALDHHHPVQNSEVYLLHSGHAPPIAPPSPPSPPSPVTPCERALSPSSDDLMSITPLELEGESPFSERIISRGVHMLDTAATAVSFVTRLYQTDPVAQRGLVSTVNLITSHGDRGKLVIVGIGKSGHIAKKIVATMNSLKIHATYLHPTEALHGDLGKVGKHDTVLMITFSGKTPELLSLLPHLEPSLCLVVMTAHTHPSTCEIIRRRPGSILLPSPIHISETESFGVSAPTTSTSVAIALGDALAHAISLELHPSVAAVFGQNHPGGAIGATYAGPQKISDLTIEFTGVSETVRTSNTAFHILTSAYRSESGWVRHGEQFISSPCRIKRLRPEDMDKPALQIEGLMVRNTEWIIIPSHLELSDAKEWILNMRRNSHGSNKYDDDAILVTMEDGEVSGVLEVGRLMHS